MGINRVDNHGNNGYRYQFFVGKAERLAIVAALQSPKT